MFKSETNIQLRKKNDEDPKGFVRAYLKKKCVNENFINDILKFGLVEQCIKVLLSQGLTNDDIELIKNKLKEENDSDICLSISQITIISKHLDADYLKVHFNTILSSGLREIVLKKPFDPIEYLGYWLLHYRSCEKREKSQKEFEAELLEERSKWQEANKNRCSTFKEPFIHSIYTISNQGSEAENLGK